VDDIGSQQAPEPEPEQPEQPAPRVEDLAEPPARFRAGHPRIGWLELLAVGAGGALGALARVAASLQWPSAPGAWPWAIFAVNIGGAFILGCLMTGLRHGPISIPVYRLLGTGFCGALTTFSTIQIQLLRMLEGHRYGLAGGYLAASLAGGYAAVSLAARLTGRAALAAAAAAATEAQA
jgi:fluoride exporter